MLAVEIFLRTIFFGALRLDWFIWPKLCVRNCVQECSSKTGPCTERNDFKSTQDIFVS